LVFSQQRSKVVELAAPIYPMAICQNLFTSCDRAPEGIRTPDPQIRSQVLFPNHGWPILASGLARTEGGADANDSIPLECCRLIIGTARILHGFVLRLAPLDARRFLMGSLVVLEQWLILLENLVPEVRIELTTYPLPRGCADAAHRCWPPEPRALLAVVRLIA
jgi:hypothetical protein